MSLLVHIPPPSTHSHMAKAMFYQKIGKSGQKSPFSMERVFWKIKFEIIEDDSDKDSELWAELMGHFELIKVYPIQS